ncbi:MAG: VOC family protein [Cellulomonas sp.]
MTIVRTPLTAAHQTGAPLVARPDSIAAGTAMDAVTLLVEDLDLQTRYYHEALAFDVIDDPAGRIVGSGKRDAVTLGRGDTPLVVLRHTPGLPRPARGQAGLYHTAILFDERAGLAATLASIAAHAPTTYIGSADHLVSLAFYFTDPEGNGVELYWDRSRSDWAWTPDGQVQMDALRLDPYAFLGEHLTESGRATPGAGEAVVGHVHLQVGDVPTARGFYVDALGFDETLTWNGALFVSAGGYHHHLAMNTWNSAGAGPRASSIGLGEVAIVVPTADDVAALEARLGHHGIRSRNDGATLHFEDPWRNHLKVSIEG